MAAAAVVGALTGLVVAAFKSSIALIVAACYSGDEVVQSWTARRLGGASVLIPAFGGVVVAALRLASPSGKIGPSLADHVAEATEMGSLGVRGASAARPRE